MDISEDNSHLVASYNEINEDSHVLNQNQADALCRTLESTFNQYVKLNKKVPPEVLSSVAGISDVSKLADSIAAHMTLKMDEKQKVLELSNIRSRAEFLIASMEKELDVLQVEKKIRGRVKQQMEKSPVSYTHLTLPTICSV